MESGSCWGIAVAIYYCGGLRSREGKRRLPAEISIIKVRLLDKGTLYDQVPNSTYRVEKLWNEDDNDDTGQTWRLD